MRAVVKRAAARALPAPHPQLSGAAKFPHLTLESPSLDLGTSAVGRAASGQLRIANLSPVPARFRVLREDVAAAAGVAPLVDAAHVGGDDAFVVSPAE